jgi:hypothetical protein
MTTKIKNYRCKPVLKQAMEWDGSFESGVAIIRWIVKNGGQATMTVRAQGGLSKNYVRLWVITSGGQTDVEPGDFVFAYNKPQKEEGIFHVCDPETFNSRWVEEK